MHLFDTNPFIEAKNTYYPFAVAPGYWEWLRSEHEAGHIASISAVREELLRQDDELSEWAKDLPNSFWIEESTETLDALRQVATWAMSTSRQYLPAARSEFLNVADFRLIAAALAGGHTVVTREQPSPASKNRILIPDVCDAHGVKWASPFETYQRLGLRLVQPIGR
ncbi:DUF4411 family protein [Agromyces larvae]|uniref:DUF4411 family protein n=1 Tax=Agromyces larvae TaxID=2929802 RepID=A0ABY4C603_9MICO|nr:DUF4411 family protein [Agromyces larvae]UOE44155.1 DUF4411 family protein [Agromyces larvae]